MGEKAPLDELDIDINNDEEMSYIAAKFGCSKGDIVVAIETIKSCSRANVYTWLVDFTFQNRRE
jgi:hypothetical protein